MDAFDLRGRQVGAEAERVGARGQSAHRRTLDRFGPAGALHLQRVGHHDAVEAEFGPQQVDQGRVPRRRLVAERVEADVCGHHRTHAGLDGGGERRQGPLAQDVEARVGRRQLQMRVGNRLAVAGEMLDARGDADALHALDEGCDVPGHELRIGAERANADDRAGRVDEHVGHGREVDVDPGRRQLAADRPSDAARQGGVVDRAEREVPRERAPARGLEPGDVAALLVGRHQQVRLLRTQRGRQCGHLLRLGDVAGEEDDAAEALLQQSFQPVRNGLAEEAGEETGRRSGAEPAVAHPRTAPAVSPNPIFRCTIRKKTITGIAISVEPAIRPPQSVFRLVPVK